MKFVVENIAKVKFADIALNGITVVAGENDTGKSTIGKALYCIFNSFYQLKDQIQETRTRMISNAIQKDLDGEYGLSVEVLKILSRIDESPELYLEGRSYTGLRALLDEYVHLINRYDEEEETNWSEDQVQRVAQDIGRIRGISNAEIYRRILQQRLNREFDNEVNYLPNLKMEAGRLTLTIQKDEIEIDIREQQVKEISKLVPLQTQAIYIDSPFVIDALSYSYVYRRFTRRYTHKEHLEQCLRTNKARTDVEQAIEEIIVDRRMNRILSEISKACDGALELSGLFRESFRYVEKTGVEINVSNISAGMKTFIILKRLLQNGYLEEKGTLILDEPEIHLHPEWQILFAEIIVLLQKEYNMHILLTTHSPYFLRAIEVYSANYNIADKCKYYLSANNEEGRAIVQDVTTRTNLVYDKLLRPFEQLQLEQYSHDKS